MVNSGGGVSGPVDAGPRASTGPVHQEATEIGLPSAPIEGILPPTPTWSASNPMDLRNPSTMLVSANVSCFRSQYSPLMVRVGEEKAPELLNSSGRRIV